MNLRAAASALEARPGVIICYAHDREGKWAVPVLRTALAEQGFDVVSDHDLTMLNPTSMQGWMDHEISTRVVLCWLSPNFINAFNQDDDAVSKGPPRLGLRYEIRSIRQKIYYHPYRFGCPVIPIALPGFPAEKVPETLRALEIHRFDPTTGSGAERLGNRISALSAHRGDGLVTTMNGTTKPPVQERSIRQVVYELERADPESNEAVELVHECLRLDQDPKYESELPKAFPAGERVIKSVGDLRLMRAFSQECLRLLRIQPQLQWDRELEARVMICAEGWYLQREHRVQEALRIIEDGVRLAEQYEDRRGAAFGLKHLGRVRRVLAKEARGEDREYHLRIGEESLERAVALFTAIHGRQSHEVGACVSAQARTQLLRYRMFGDESALSRAAALADRAEYLLQPNCGRDYYDLLILFAEVELANKRYQRAKDLITQAIEQIASPRPAQISEVLGRAHRVRAQCVVAARGSKQDALRDLKRAADIFATLEQDQAVAKCQWVMLTVDSSTITSIKLSTADVQIIEALTLDHRVRILAVKEAERRQELRVLARQVRHRIDWTYIVEKVTRER